MNEGNYSKMQEKARALFLEYDQKRIMQKPFVHADERFFIVLMLGEEYRVDRRSGDVLGPKGGIAGFDEALTIYDLLTHEGNGAMCRGSYCTLQALDRSARESSGELGEIYAGSAKRCEAKLSEFMASCEALGRGFAGKGDLNYEFDLFDFMKLRVSFWRADEDFPASLKIYVDEGILGFLLYETVYYAIGVLLDRIIPR